MGDRSQELDTLPPGKRCGIYCAGGWLSRCGRLRNISPPPVFDTGPSGL